MFQAVLFTVIAYLVGCYAYGLFLLWKLWTGRRLERQLAAYQGPILEAAPPSDLAPPAPLKRAA